MSTVLVHNAAKRLQPRPRSLKAPQAIDTRELQRRMHRNPSRPLSPHLTIWKWGPHMLVSILHRVTGTGLATVGALAFVWWLVAAATGPEAYESFTGWATSWFGIIVAIGLSWAFFQHLLSGLRH